MEKTCRRRLTLVPGMILACLLAWCLRAAAQDLGLDVSQYGHTAWRVRDGFTQGAITAIAQTPDGYLWVGTESGLVRFDGARAIPWRPPMGQQLPSNDINRLLVAQDGTLWIATIGGLASWRDDKFTNYPETSGQNVISLLQDRQGTVWFGLAAPGRICSLEGGKAKCYGDLSFGGSAPGFFQDPQGNLWAAVETGLWLWRPAPERYAFPNGKLYTAGIIQDDSGSLLLATSDGLKQLVHGKIQNYAPAGVAGHFRSTSLLRSSDGSLWVGGPQGLMHLRQGKTDTFGAAEGLSGDLVLSIFQDQEETIWVGTTEGLDQFCKTAFPRISRDQGLSTSTTYSVQATADGAVWIATSTGLNRWKNGQVTVYGKSDKLRQKGQDGRQARDITRPVTEIGNSGLEGATRSMGLDDEARLLVSTTTGVYYFEGGRFIRSSSIAGNTWWIAGDGQGKMWIDNGTDGLFYVRPGDAAQPIPWSQFGGKQYGARSLLPDRSRGGVWLGFYEGGVAYFQDGQIRASYNSANGLGKGRVTDLRFGPRGTLWAGTEGGLSRIRDGRVMTLTSTNGLPCDEVHWSMEDDEKFVWLYMPCGLVRIARSELDAWVVNPGRKLQIAMFDSSDGVPITGVYGSAGPHVSKATDGKIWFVNRQGLTVIDPRHIPYNKMPPPVRIEQFTADRKRYDLASYANGRVPLPALTRDLEIGYTALSLVAPEKMRFRYKLEGRDHDWQDAGNRRRAFYTDLPPRDYRFRVMASNNSGVWNETGAFLDFSVAPVYYQTIWFRLVCVGALVALVWAIYQLRLQQLEREFNAGLDARVSERTRIARELHDSLLQGFQGMMFRLQAVRDLLPGQPSEAMQAMDLALERGDRAIAEGRDTVSDLREPIVGDKDMAEALTALSEELAAQNGNGSAPCVRVLVEGKPRGLNALLRDEIYRIAREAMRNAFRHARAQKIEAEITYGDSEFLLYVRDDGHGIDPAIANQGARAGHWGLPGMRERAKSFGGKLEVWSEDGAGTEIELSVPGGIAYGKNRPRRTFRFWRGKIGGTQ